MKYIKMLGLTALTAMATGALTAGSASATTLEVGGVTKNSSVSLTASIAPGGSTRLSSFGITVGTCTQSHLTGHMTTKGGTNGTLEPGFTGIRVGGPITTLTFTNCTHDAQGLPIKVDRLGGLSVEYIAGTTNGTVFLHGTELTMYSTLHGTYVNCKTGEGTHIGTITGTKTGHATIDINATLNCGPHINSAKWEGTYTVTSPAGLGVVA